MAIKIPSEKIAQVREATDIVSLISNYLTLKRAGKSYVGLCPFHADSSPSFHVNPQNQLYYCFGCQKGGDVFNFLMEMEKMSFTEAVELLAEKAGISLPRTQVDNALEKEKEALFYVNRWAANFFYKNLWTSAGAKALHYLRQRGISDEMIKTFGLGYSLPSWDGLIKQAKKDSISLPVLQKTGLIIRKSDGGYYDRFRGRFMIPIVNLNKKVLGFGGRILTADQNQPKYINSPETPIYQKGNILFGLYQSREAIREQDRAIFVEGYTDLISLFQAGIKNVVATSGTSLTPNQARLIRRFTENVVLLYDADTAGSFAAMRGANIFLDEGIEVRIAVLPAGSDPDSFIRKQGLEKFKQLLKRSQSIIQFKINTLIGKYDKSTSQGVAQIINELLTSIIHIKNSIKQNLAVKEVAEYFGLDEMALMQQLASVKRTQRTQPITMIKKDEKVKVRKPTKTKYDLAEESLLRLALSEIRWLPRIMQYLDLEEVRNPQLRELFSRLMDLYQKNEEVDRKVLLDQISDPLLSAQLAQILSKKIDVMVDREKLFEDCLVLLKKRKLENRLHNLAQEIKLAQEKEQDASEYIRKYQQCREEIKLVESKKFLEEQA